MLRIQQLLLDKTGGISAHMALALESLSKISNKHVNEWTENMSGGDKWYEENRIGVKR